MSLRAPESRRLLRRLAAHRAMGSGRAAGPTSNSLVELERRVGDVLAERVVVRILGRHVWRGFEQQGLPGWALAFLRSFAAASARGKGVLADVDDVPIETPPAALAAVPESIIIVTHTPKLTCSFSLDLLQLTMN